MRSKEKSFTRTRWSFTKNLSIWSANIYSRQRCFRTLLAVSEMLPVFNQLLVMKGPSFMLHQLFSSRVFCFSNSMLLIQLSLDFDLQVWIHFAFHLARANWRLPSAPGIMPNAASLSHMALHWAKQVLTTFSSVYSIPAPTLTMSFVCYRKKKRKIHQRGSLDSGMLVLDSQAW